MRLSTIEKKVNKLAKNWVGEKHIPSIIRQLNKEFARYIIYFKSCRYDQRFYEDHAVIVSAHYCPRISLGIPENIIVTLHFPVENKKAKISPACAQNMAMKIIRAIHHEYRHQYQQRLRGFSNTKEYQTKDTDKNPERLQYFGNPHGLPGTVAGRTGNHGVLGKYGGKSLSVCPDWRSWSYPPGQQRAGNGAPP